MAESSKASDTIDPPFALRGAAAARWRELARAGLTEAQVVDLAAYCAAYGRWVDAEEWLADPEHGPVLTIRDDKGQVRSHGPAPQLAVSAKALTEMRKLAPRLRAILR